MITDKEFYCYRRESIKEVVFGFRAARESVVSILDNLESFGYSIKLGVAFLSPDKRSGIAVKYMNVSKLMEFFEVQDASRGYYDDVPLEKSVLSVFYSL